jgi:hypothetical protein
MFQSEKGIFFLNRSRQVSYIGASVEAYNDQAVTRATLVGSTTQVRFLTSSGRTLLFDYLFGQWSTWTNHEGIDAVVSNGTYYYARDDGRIFKENQTSYADDGARIPLVIETAWLGFLPQLQGFCRFWHVRLLGEWKSQHTLSMQYALDYTVDGNWSQPVPFVATTMGGSNYGDGNYGDGNYGGTANAPYQWRWHIGAHGMKARFRFTDSEPAGIAGPSFGLTELLLTGGIKGTAIRPFPDNRSG